jgi:hypothetical protein
VCVCVFVCVKLFHIIVRYGLAVNLRFGRKFTGKTCDV